MSERLSERATPRASDAIVDVERAKRPERSCARWCTTVDPDPTRHERVHP